MSHTHTRLIGAAGTLGALALVAGVPLALIAVGLSPTQIAAHPIWTNLLAPDDGTLLWVAIGALAWLLWVVIAGLILLEAAAQTRGIHAPNLHGLAVPQAAVRTLVGWAALLFIAAPGEAAAATPGLASTDSAVAVEVTNIPALLDVPNRTSAPERAIGRTVAAPDTRATNSANVTAAYQSSATVRTSPPDRTVPGTVAYQVTRGDTLWRIAEKHLGDPLRYTEIAALNRDILGDDPDFITPPMALLLPDDGHVTSTSQHDDSATVIVEPGDTLSQIALDELGDANRYPEIFNASTSTAQPDGAKLIDPDLIQPGWRLTIPTTGAAQQGATATTDKQGESPDREHPRSNANRPAEPEPATNPHTSATNPAEQAPTPAERPRATETSGTPAPSTTPTPETAATSSPAASAGWLIPALTGAGSLLAGVLFLRLRANRRSQLRFRTPGMLIAPEPAETVPVDRRSRVVGGPVAPRIQALDALLRSLASSYVEPSEYPPLLAVELAAETATLHLADDADLGEPWTGADTRWTAPLGTTLECIDVVAPYPMLVSIGADDAGAAWLLNLERFGVLSVAGEAQATQKLGRHLAAELALSPWSTLVQVHTLGFGQELTDLDEFRLTPYPAGDTRAFDAATRSALASDDDDPEELHVVVIASGAAPAEASTRLSEVIAAHESRPGAAVVTLTDAATESATIIEVDDERLRVPRLGIDLRVPGLSEPEAAAVAEIVRATQSRANVPMPVDVTITEGYGAFINQTGALREPLVDERPAPDEEAGPTSLLPEPAAAYVDAAATTEQDVAALAPPVPPSTADDVFAADPTLDADLELWRLGDECPVSRVMLLGTLRATAHGVSQEVSERKHHYIELMTYLWAHPHGVPSATLSDEFGYTRERARVEISHLRKYLGVDPRTGEEYLPTAPSTRERTENGWTGYSLQGVLFDIDLFRRLRARAQARGGDGLPDLVAALRLVRGEPFADLRADSWAWMFEGERFDQEFAAAIVDVAHLVATRSMKDCDLPTARRAAEIALSASPYDETARLDLARIAELEGNDAEAAQIREDGIYQRTDDYRPPLDPSQRTQKFGAVRRRSTKM
ncbi:MULTISPECIES: LysM peptidoglycan-binding domain-containing protein [unclassified Isoptericola]|uniref:LysM peptidoglycan-binding domain-containing protein n=1 Tax=unclassified Isoptericola TaxID=2623355 RepID=UPI003660AE45